MWESHPSHGEEPAQALWIWCLGAQTPSSDFLESGFPRAASDKIHQKICDHLTNLCRLRLGEYLLKVSHSQAQLGASEVQWPLRSPSGIRLLPGASLCRH